MLYDSYRGKIQKVVDFMRKVFAHMVLIVVVFSAIVILVAAFLATKGIILDVGECKSEIYYGENTGFEAKALFSSVRYEYSELGTDKWSETVPKYPGKYSVRAVSNGSFGSKKYTETQSFTILPLDIELKATESSIQYGVSPTPNSVVLKNGDRIANLDFEFDSKAVGLRKVKINADTLVIKNIGGKDVTKCYNISTPETGIQITKRVVNITTGSIDTVYNGKPVSCPDYEIMGGDSIADGETLKVVYYPTVEGVTERELNFGSSSFFQPSTPVVNEISFRIYDSNGVDVTENYDLIITYGEIKVSQKPMEFHTDSAVWTYDAKAHSNNSYTYDGLIEGHRLEATEFNEVIYPTTAIVPNSARVKIFDENGKDVTLCYHITYDIGTLTVKKRPLLIKTGSDSWVYDGTPHYSDEYEIVIDGERAMPLVDGHKLVIEEHRTVTDVVSVLNEPIKIKIYSGEEGSEAEYHHHSYYDISYEAGTISVTKRPIILSTGSGSWTYDGTEHSVETFDIQPGSAELKTALAEGEVFEIQSFKKVINAGTFENVPSYIIYSETKKTTSNYEIIPAFGTLTVEKRHILVQTGSCSWVYDGENHSYPVAFAISDPNDKYDDILPGHKIHVLESSTITEVGSTDNLLTLFRILDGGLDLISNYEISYDYGTIEVTKRPVTVLTGSAEWIYDGQPHSTTDYSVISHYDFLDGDYLDVITSTSITNAGHTDNVFTKYDVKNEENKPVFDNYDITFKYGTLTVIPRPITVTSASDEKRYDGTPLTNPLCILAEDSAYDLLEGHEIRASVTGSRTAIGVSPNTIDPKSVKIFANGKDISYNYDVKECYEGTLEIFPFARITVTTGNASKVYDGKPLTCAIFTYMVDGKLLDGHSLNVITDGSITEVGRAKNTGYAWVADENGKDITEQYYTVEVKYGILEVKETEDEPITGTIYAKICTGKTGYVYLRMHSYGDLKGQTWYEAKEYDGVLPGGYSYNYLTSIALENYGAKSDYMVVTESEVYFLPYYPSPDGKYDIQISDTKYSSDLKEYELEFFILPNDFDFEELKGNLLGYSEYEKIYRDFVYENYVNYASIDTATINLMLTIIDENDFDPSQPDIINRVAEYIRNAATYNINYDERLDQVSNMVVAFLNRYKEGKCTHFAAAATMLFRTLGIPARYVEGFALETKAGEFVDVTSPGHAWVEVYLDGIGWVPVEVTPGFEGPGISDDGDQEGKRTIDVTPKFVYKDYDGTYLYAANEIEYNQSIKWLLDNGYTYTVDIRGERLNPGISESVVVSFEIYDKSGKNVTSEFDVRKYNGVVRIYGESIKLYLYQIQKYYDGTPLEYDDGDYEIIDMPEGYTLDLDINISITDCGFLTLDEINKNIDSYITYKVYGKDGSDITDEVSIVFDVFNAGDEDYIPIKIDQCKIELTAASEKKEYEEEIELTNDEVYVSKGNLANGHTLYAKATGTINYVGTAPNEIDPYSVYILDENGHDVTDNYEITNMISGILEITAPSTKE